MRSDVKVTSGHSDEKDAKKHFGNNNKVRKRSAQPMGGSRLARRHHSSKPHTHGPDSSKDHEPSFDSKNDPKAMKSNITAASGESAEKGAKKLLGNNKHYISPYGGYGGYGGYGYGGYGYGGYGGYADPRGYGYYGGWDGNPYTMY